MRDDWGRDGEDAVAAAIHDGEVRVRVVVAHEDRECVVSGDADEAADDAGVDPELAGLAEVADILDEGESHAHADGIDDAVEVLVKCGALAEDEPEHRELGELLREARAEERYAQVVHDRLRLAGEGSEPAQRDADEQRGVGGKHAE